ncbi:MAG: DUF2125 domain-containing protein [Paracoccaceae bacterium]|nr:DUF2125 domain-containing protein [Paracoccaceae bacterium]
MPFISFRSTATAAFALLAAQTAQADIGAQEVWSNWQSYFDSSGFDVSATEVQSGNRLTLSDLVLTMPGVEGQNDAVIEMEQVTFTENGDGTVGIDVPDVMPVQMQVVGEEGETADIDMEIRQSGLISTVSGVPTEMINAYSAQSVDLVLTGLTVDGETMGDDIASFILGIKDMAGSTKSTVGGKRVFDQDMTASGVTFDFSFVDPEGSGDIKANGQMADVNFSGSSALPLAKMDAGDINAMLAAGMNGDGTFAYSAGASNMRVTENNVEAFSSATTSTGGTLDVAMSPEGLTYSGGQNNLKLAMTSPDLPVPLDIDMVKSSFNLTMPIQKSEEAEDFALGFSLNDFSMSEALWGMFDPGAQLPRNPATIALDLTGKAKVLVDMFATSPEVLTSAPAELETVDINKLQITVAGAELTGEGAFRFKNDAPGGMPQPIGVADLSLVGGNKLIDTLVAMGLLPEDQAMGARMMMGLLAVPGDAPDTLNSQIEMNEQGHILANGQRIQ